MHDEDNLSLLETYQDGVSHRLHRNPSQGRDPVTPTSWAVTRLSIQRVGRRRNGLFRGPNYHLTRASLFPSKVSTWPAEQTYGTIFPAGRPHNRDPARSHVLQSPRSHSQTCADSLGLLTILGQVLMLCCKYASMNPLLSLDLICKGSMGRSVITPQVNTSH